MGKQLIIIFFRNKWLFIICTHCYTICYWRSFACPLAT